MKSIAIVTNVRGTPLGQFLKDNLASVFADHADIHNYYISELEKDESINDDVVLVMTKTKAIEIKDHVHDGRRIVVVQRTIRESEIKKLRAIPAERRFVPHTIGTVIDNGQ
jgi:hypothetical protein